MKRKIALVLLVALTLTLVPYTGVYAMETVEVATIEEFQAAVKSDTRIVLTSQWYEFQTQIDFTTYKNITLLDVENVHNLEIVGTGNTVISFYGNNAFLMRFNDCSNITFDSIKFSSYGHDIKHCMDGRFEFTNCSNVNFKYCTIEHTDSVFDNYNSTININNCEINTTIYSPFKISTNAIYNVNNSSIKNCVSPEPMYAQGETIVNYWSSYDGDVPQGAAVYFNNCYFEGNNCEDFVTNWNTVAVNGCQFYNNYWTNAVKVQIKTISRDGWDPNSQPYESINGVYFTRQMPVTINGRALVPVADVMDNLSNVNYWWNEATSTVEITKYDYDKGDYNNDYVVLRVNVPIGSNYITVNGKQQKIDVAAQTINGKTMLPIRAVTDALGLSIWWDEAAKTITVTQEVTYMAGGMG